MASRRLRVDQVEQTRAVILATAERLFAERGVFAVSNRQISEAAGQGNNTAVTYHFGSKPDLVQAIIARHAEPMEEIRRTLVARHQGSTGLRDWVTCVVRPYTDHLTDLGGPTWYARFAAQLMADPQLRELAGVTMGRAPMLWAVSEGLHGCLPHLPVEVRRERDEMAHTLIVHSCAQRELTAHPDWTATASGLIDAIEGLYRADHSAPR
ncbi:TetR/AcrR family transcriptional regulator [Actinoplanes derwentensis]|uniref:Regulatory protein, tetR family n=1 Tax=Actinoplanes derwentensis TaxID=113562 RepID=A0A1H1Y5B5_9ACTN|nr:helix-turn-helix domain-containing protein [Actinoplanes derwentensis]GID86718.1 TetR family transcriptional regulator [Actinoplanes derwentensis]SDT16623.1 regulatory protein, tetR family [Actinoplanes derwentensis]